MHYYAERVVEKVQGVTTPDGRGGYLRIRAGVDPNHARIVLTGERDFSQEQINGMQAPDPTICGSESMQVLILTSLLLSRPEAPVDISVVAAKQPSVGRVSENLEKAAGLLAGMLAKTLEVVAQV